MPAEADTSTERLRRELDALAPWHLDVTLNPRLSTRAFLDAPERPGSTTIEVEVHLDPGAEPVLREAFVPGQNAEGTEPSVLLLDPREEFLGTLRGVYPNGLEGRSVLDCACNCGAYLFWAKEMGAGRCFGFDLREHWIRQARFLMANREGPTDDMGFDVCDIYELPELELEPFDVVLFNGILYHLPDPIDALRLSAGLAREMVLVNTGARSGVPDGSLIATQQPRSHVTSGSYGLRWMPSGPRVLERMLAWLGFGETRCSWWRRQGGTGTRDRIELLGARDPDYFEHFDRSLGEGAARVCAIVSTHVAPETAVLVISGGDDELLEVEGRKAYHFPQHEDGRWTGAEFDGTRAVSHLEELREAGAEYFVMPPTALGWMRERPELQRHLQRYPTVMRSREGVIYALTPPGADVSDLTGPRVAWLTGGDGALA